MPGVILHTAEDVTSCLQFLTNEYCTSGFREEARVNKGKLNNEYLTSFERSVLWNASGLPGHSVSCVWRERGDAGRARLPNRRRLLWVFREDSQHGRRLCSLSVYHWQRAAACVIDSFTNQSSCSSTKHPGTLPVYSLNGPKSTGLIGWLPQLSLSLSPPSKYASSSAPLSLYALSFLSFFFSLIPLSPSDSCRCSLSLLEHTVWNHAYLHIHTVQILTI